MSLRPTRRAHKARALRPPRRASRAEAPESLRRETWQAGAIAPALCAGAQVPGPPGSSPSQNAGQRHTVPRQRRARANTLHGTRRGRPHLSPANGGHGTGAFAFLAHVANGPPPPPRAPAHAEPLPRARPPPRRSRCPVSRMDRPHAASTPERRCCYANPPRCNPRPCQDQASLGGEDPRSHGHHHAHGRLRRWRWVGPHRQETQRRVPLWKSPE